MMTTTPPTQSMSGLSKGFGVNHSQHLRHLKTMMKIQNTRKWVAYKLSEWCIGQCLTSRKSLPAKDDKKSFLLNIKKGLL